MNKIENKGFILKPEFYSQEEWCELYLQLIKNYQKMKRKINKKNNNWNELKDYINRFLYMLNGIIDRDIYEQCQLDDFTQIMDKIKELENGQSND